MAWAPLLLSLLTYCSACSSSQPVVTQLPSVSVSPGNTVKLSCTMSSGTSISSYAVYWYQQKPGNPPRSLLYDCSDSSKGQGSGVPARFSGSKDTARNAGDLTVSGALAEDEVIFTVRCGRVAGAVPHSATDRRGSTSSQPVLTQPPSVSVSPGNTMKLSYTVSSGTSISDYEVHWDQQQPGNSPRSLLRYKSDSDKQQGSGVPARFSASKDTGSNAGYLTVTGALAEDEADYGCAAWRGGSAPTGTQAEVEVRQKHSTRPLLQPGLCGEL
ncbi:unnamed protein product, partial [Eretmochelys imbricata]